MEYNRPGVYIEEVSLLPPSVAGVSTAIPAFLGYTATGSTLRPTRITSLLEFTEIFGGPPKIEYSVSKGESGFVINAAKPAQLNYWLYYAVKMFFQQAGETPCYIVSIGTFEATGSFVEALATLEKEDEPTLILFPEAVQLGDADLKALSDLALGQCAKLKDRFVIIDVKQMGTVDESMNTFRNDAVGSNELKYGAAYFPYLDTVLTYEFDEELTHVNFGEKILITGSDGLKVIFAGEGGAELAIIAEGEEMNFEIIPPGEEQLTILKISGVGDGKIANDVKAAWDEWSKEGNLFSLVQIGEGAQLIQKTASPLQFQLPTLEDLKTAKTSIYNEVKALLGRQRVTLPPSAAIAGVYAKVDAERGVWKAPANVSLNGVIGPNMKITDAEQDRLNVHADGGKSINAIRNFTGKGTLVWGARTLAGNDNEWRYVPVRRLFNFMEESIKKACEAFVFEPNTAATWLKVRGMIESFLFGLWQRGALAGATPGEAYFVNVGLGKTMTPKDILEGYMKVEVGVAAVRPAEFIILQFSHKMQES